MSRRTNVGIDLGQRLIKAAWVVGPDDEPGMLRLERGQSTDAEAFSRLRSALELRGVRRPLVGLLAPNHLVKSTVVDVPAKGGQAPREVIAAGEFYRQLGLKPETCNVRIGEVPATARRSTGDRMLVSGFDRERGELLCDAAVQSGLDLVHLCIASDALLASGVVPTDSVVTPFIDAGWENTRVLLSMNGIAFLHRVGTGLGLKDVLGPLAEQRGVAAECIEALMLDDALSEPIGDAWSGACARWAMLAAEDVRGALSYAHHRYPSVEYGPCRCIGGAFSLRAVREAFEAAATFKCSVEKPVQASWEAVGVARAVARAVVSGEVAA